MDSGTELNVLPYTVYKKLNIIDKLLVNSNIEVQKFEEFLLNVIGKIKLEFETDNTNEEIEFIIINNDKIKLIMSWNTSEILKLIQRIDMIAFDKSRGKAQFIQNHRNVFGGKHVI